ncbi:hypothetical protein DYB36_002033 [Aphanomyces astaci]|uniref:Uncharacterized protein n=1 Tax=Aphanomyces astaci TaxID=112090 RepID=A0A397B032_APHAT|nr:hypothetical protein DYB36_002033 [Aphanomyces astaci]
MKYSFERLQVAFAVLTSPRESLLTSGYDAINLELLLRAQIYIITSCAPALASSKLDAFPLVLDFLATHCTTDGLAVPPLTSHAEQLHLSLLATRLLRLSCAVSVQNIPWLLAQDQCGVVDDALQYVVTRMIDDNDPTDEATYIDTALELMQTVASLAGTSAGRQWIATTASHVLHNIWRILWYYHSFTSPPIDALFVLVRHTLEALCRMCDDATKDAPLPEKIAQNGGILWHLLDLWYAFDSAVDEQALARRLEPTVLFTEGGTTLHDDVGGHVQTLLATLSVRVFVAANKSNVITIQAVCHTLLSPNLYFQSTNPSAFKFLHLFHRDTMSHRLIWTSQMRSELKAFLAPLVNPPPASTPSSSVAQLGQSFRFSALKEHAIVDDIYLEPLHTTLSSSSFTANSVDVVRQLGLPPSFYTAAASFVRTGRLPPAAHGVVGWGITPDVELRFRELSLGILAALVPWATAQVEAGFMGRAAKSAHTGLLTLLNWVLPPEHKFMQTHPSLKEGVAALPRDSTVAFATFQSHSLTILHALAATKSFGDSLVESKVGLSVLMHAALMEDQHSGGLLETVGRLCASSHNVARYVTTSIWMYHLLIWAFPTPSVSGKSADTSGMIMDADCDYTPSMQIPAMKILSILGNPTSLVLEDTINVMVRFLPVSLIYELVNRPQNVAMILSGHYEAPDLVWNVTLRTHFYREMLQLVVIVNKCTDTEVISDELAQVDIDYASVYPYPMVGDVYLLLYLENPIHPLRDPKFFLECLFEDFEALGHALVTSLSQRSSFSPDLVMTVRQQTQILPMITSCIICALRVYPVYLDDVASWKVPDKVASLFVLLQNELRLPQPKEEEAAAVVAEVSLLRVFRVLFVSPRIVSSLAYSPYNLLSRLISHCHNLSTHKGDLHPEVGFILEVVRRFLLSFPDNGDKNSDKNVVAVVCGLNVMEMLLDMIEHPMTLQRVVNPILTRTTVIAILNYLEQHRTQGALAHHILKKQKKWDKVFRHEPTDAIRNQPEDKYLVGPAASADAMIRSFLANKAKADDTTGPHSGGSLSPPSSRRKGGPSTSQKLKNLFR